MIFQYTIFAEKKLALYTAPFTPLHKKTKVKYNKPPSQWFSDMPRRYKF